MSSGLERTGCASCFIMTDSLALRNNFPLIRVHLSATCPMCLCSLVKEQVPFPCEPGFAGSQASNLSPLPFASDDFFCYILCNFSNSLF